MFGSSIGCDLEVRRNVVHQAKAEIVIKPLYIKVGMEVREKIKEACMAFLALKSKWQYLIKIKEILAAVKKSILLIIYQLHQSVGLGGYQKDIGLVFCKYPI